LINSKALTTTVCHHPKKTHWNDVREDMDSFGTCRGMHGLTINGKGNLLG